MMEHPFFFLEESVLLLFMLVAVPALVYALEKLTRRSRIHRVFTIINYLVIFDVYFEQTEKLIKNRAEVQVRQQIEETQQSVQVNQWQEIEFYP